MFQCPYCHLPLHIASRQAKCPQNHTFDQHRSGYYNFLTKNQKTFKGDHPSMIEARRFFLSQGFYLPLIQEIDRILTEFHPQTLLDAGCGEGYYTNYLQEMHKNHTFYAFDISKDAVEKCSKLNKHIQTFVSSVNSIPLQNESMDAILSMFAPIDFNEFARILQPDGLLLVASAHPHHLIELKQMTYETIKLHQAMSIEDSRFQLVKSNEVMFSLRLIQPDITNLFLMTPYSFRTKQEDKQKVFHAESLYVTCHFTVSIYRKAILDSRI